MWLTAGHLFPALFAIIKNKNGCGLLKGPKENEANRGSEISLVIYLKSLLRYEDLTNLSLSLSLSHSLPHTHTHTHTHRHTRARARSRTNAQLQTNFRVRASPLLYQHKWAQTLQKLDKTTENSCTGLRLFSYMSVWALKTGPRSVNTCDYRSSNLSYISVLL